MDPVFLIDFTSQWAIIAAIAVLVVGFLIVRFIIKTTLTLLKIGILVGIGFATYLGMAWLVDFLSTKV